MVEKPKYQIYFVLNGLVNGEDGKTAHEAGPLNALIPIQKDGWYWLLDGMVDGKGPFPSRNVAVTAAESEPMVFSFATDGTYRPYKDEDGGTGMVPVTVTQKAKNHYLLVCECYYSNGGIFNLEITQKLERALNTFSALLLADSQQEDLDCSNSKLKPWTGAIKPPTF